MLLLSLGSEAIAALLCQGRAGAFSGPDLVWLLHGPDMAPAAASGCDAVMASEKVEHAQ